MWSEDHRASYRRTPRADESISAGKPRAARTRGGVAWPLVSRLLELLAPSRMGRAFRWNLASVWAANLGDGIALAAGPLLVASQTREPTLIAAAAMVQQVPTLVFGLYAGALADRVDRTRLVVWANLARALVIVAMAVTIVTGHVSIGVVLGALFLGGVAEILVDSGTRTVLPMIVTKADLGVGNARLMSGYLVANQMAGPPIGAFLFAAGMAWPFGVQAIAVVFAAWLFLRMELPRGGVRGVIETQIRRDIVDGIRWMWAHPAIRTLAVVILIFNVTWGAPWSILVLYAQDRLGMGSVGFGLLTTAVAVGGMAGTAAYGWLERRIPLATLMRGCLTMEVLTHLAFALTSVEWVALVVMVIFGGYAFVWASLSGAVRQRATPVEYQGRVGSVYSLFLVGGLIVGQFLGGLIASRWGVTAPFWFAFAGSGLTLLVVWRSVAQIAHAGAAD